VSGFDGYFLRQDKASPKKVVYLGSARKHCCVFHDKLFTINSLSLTGRAYHPLICKNINTGEQTEMNVLSDKSYGLLIGGNLHFYCQDVVHSLEVKENTMILEIHRYPADTTLTKETYKEESIYFIHIKYIDGQFVVERIYE
jgi:hypothetical protein